MAETDLGWLNDLILADAEALRARRPREGLEQDALPPVWELIVEDADAEAWAFVSAGRPDLASLPSRGLRLISVVRVWDRWLRLLVAEDGGYGTPLDEMFPTQ